jgi:hypothetical protein
VTARRAVNPAVAAELDTFSPSDDAVAAVDVERTPPTEPSADAGTWLPTADAAALLNVSPDTVTRRRKLGQLQGRTDGRGRWLVLVEAPAPAEPVVAADVLELALLRQRVADLERERETMVANLAAWQEQAHRSDVLAQQLAQRLPRLHGADDYIDAGDANGAATASTSSRRRRWWQRGEAG